MLNDFNSRDLVLSSIWIVVFWFIVLFSCCFRFFALGWRRGLIFNWLCINILLFSHFLLLLFDSDDGDDDDESIIFCLLVDFFFIFKCCLLIIKKKIIYRFNLFKMLIKICYFWHWFCFEIGMVGVGLLGVYGNGAFVLVTNVTIWFSNRNDMSVDGLIVCWGSSLGSSSMLCV